jgi:hypothetical protein
LTSETDPWRNAGEVDAPGVYYDGQGTLLRFGNPTAFPQSTETSRWRVVEDGRDGPAVEVAPWLRVYGPLPASPDRGQVEEGAQ